MLTLAPCVSNGRLADAEVVSNLVVAAHQRYRSVAEGKKADYIPALATVQESGLPFNSVIAVEQTNEGLSNPMVNAGAISATSLAPGATADAKWRFTREQH